MATAESVKTKIQGLISQSNEATGKEDTDLTAAVGSLIAGFGQGGWQEISEDWQRPSNWPDLSSLGVPEAGTIYLTYDCRDNISGEHPRQFKLSGRFEEIKRGYIENGQFVSVATAANHETLPIDEGDFVVYKIKTNTGWGFLSDSNMQDMVNDPCVEVYGTAEGSRGSLDFSNSYSGPSPALRACTIYGNKAMTFNATGVANYDYIVERLNTQDWVDDTARTNMSWTFCNLIKIRHLVLPFTTSNVTNFYSAIRGNVSMETLDVSTFDTSAATNMSYMFYGNRRLKKLDLSNFVTTGVTDFTQMLGQCYSLYDVNFSGLDTSGATATPIKIFDNNLDLVNLKVGKINKSFIFNNCYKLSHDSLMNVINALEPTDTTLTLTIGTKNLEKLTAEEIAIATEKGWSIL